MLVRIYLKVASLPGVKSGNLIDISEKNNALHINNEKDQP
ncbi:hypothetical protein CHCC20333_4456 [Bacillus paralicheniformis]|nr:hypothetical protein CHCC20333_4456 [Bacillus paralicheniformis]